MVQGGRLWVVRDLAPVNKTAKLHSYEYTPDLPSRATSEWPTDPLSMPLYPYSHRKNPQRQLSI